MTAKQRTRHSAVSAVSPVSGNVRRLAQSLGLERKSRTAVGATWVARCTVERLRRAMGLQGGGAGAAMPHHDPADSAGGHPVDLVDRDFTATSSKPAMGGRPTRAPGQGSPTCPGRVQGGSAPAPQRRHGASRGVSCI